MKKQPSGRGYKCRHKWCPNYYTDVIGGDNAFGKHKAGALCIPCLYAMQMVEYNQTIEQVEGAPRLMAMFTELLAKTGWTWQHMKDSFERMSLQPKERWDSIQ